MSANPVTSAGKLHLLDLGHLKERFGGKWPRMASHVETFFEAAIRRSLGPGDTFSRMGELSYIVLFRELSAEEAQLKCQTISEEVCERLFGQQGTQVTLRNLVANVSIASLPPGIEAHGMLDALLEREGKETIVSRQAPDRIVKAEVAQSERILSLRFANDSTVLHRISTAEIDYLYRPVWDAAKQVVVTYLCQPATRPVQPEATGFWTGGNDADQAALDLVLLDECALRTARLHADGFRILTALPVHFSTLTRSRFWSAYSEAHRRIPAEVVRDMASIVVGIEQGVPNIRLGQELPKLSNITRNIFCVVDDGGSAGIRFSGTGARAVGISIAPADPEVRSIERIKKLGQEAQDAGLDAFVLGLRSTSVAINAIGAGIRYLEGPIIRPASADPRHAFAQSVEYLYQSKLAAQLSTPAA